MYTLPSRKVFAGWTDEDVKKYKYVPLGWVVVGGV